MPAHRSPVARRSRTNGPGTVIFVALALWSLLSSGCVVLAGVAAYGHAQWHSTSFVTPPSTPTADLPASGKSISVRVEDMRAGVAGYEVGSKLTTQWGYEAATIDLKDKSPLANCIARDVLATLRQRGYRGVPMDDTAAGPAEVVLTVRVHVFTLVVSEGDRMDGDALVSLEAVDSTTGRRAGIDAVGVRVNARKSGFGGEYQGLFELLYNRLRDQLGEKLPAVVQG